MDTPYKGTYFGLAAGKGAVILFGLRGNAFRSVDGGASWTKVDTGLREGVTAAATTGGRVILASQTGRLLVSDDDGAHFSPVTLGRAVPVAAVQPLGTDAVLVGGARGVRVQPLR